MALEKTEEQSNASFFDKANADMGLNEEPNSLTSDLEAQQAESLDGVAPKTGDDEFVLVNEEDQNTQTEEEKKAAETAVVEETAPAISPEVAGLMESIGSLTDLQRSQIQATQDKERQQAEVDLDPEPTADYNDPASVQAWAAWNSRESDRKIAASIEAYHQKTVVPIAGAALDGLERSQLADAKAVFGDRLDWKRDEAAIREVQKANNTLSVTDAFRHVDYNRVVTEQTNTVEKTAELANAATVSSGPAAKVKGPTPTTLVVTKEDREMATRFDMPIKEWMKQKHLQETQPEASLI